MILTARLSQIAFNARTYLNFYRFLELKKRTGDVISHSAIFGVSNEDGAFEWAGDTMQNLLCKPSSIFDLGMWRLVFDVLRFNACALRVLYEGGDPTIEAYVKKEGYSTQFTDMFLVVCTCTRPRLCGPFGSVVDRYSP
jgi:predicted NAD/FAD-binding protein